MAGWGGLNDILEDAERRQFIERGRAQGAPDAAPNPWQRPEIARVEHLRPDTSTPRIQSSYSQPVREDTALQSLPPLNVMPNTNPV